MSLASDLIQKVKIGAKQLESSLVQGVGEASEFVRKNPVTSAATVGGGVLAGVTAVQIIRSKRKKTTSKKKKKSTKKKKKAAKRKTKKKSAKKRTRSKKGSKKIYKTKTGQPYIILPNGRARFISKASAKRRRKLKGGYY